MLFRRKKPASWREMFRIAVWPRHSWSRSGKYVAKRILRLTGSPHAIAAGVAAGVFASCTPFLGFHFVIAFAVAYLIAGNFIAAAMGTFFGNPVTFPFIWASTYTTGHVILSGSTRPHPNGNGHQRLGEIANSDIMNFGFGPVIDKITGLWQPVVMPMMVGAIPVGILAGIIAYLLTRWIAIGFQAARRKRLAAKAEALKQNGKKKASERLSKTNMPEQVQ